MKKAKKRKKRHREGEWKRCGDCGGLVKVPADPRGLACPKCGEPLSKARDW